MSETASRLRSEPRSYGALADLARGKFSPGLLIQAGLNVMGYRLPPRRLISSSLVMPSWAKAFRVVVLNRVR